MKISGKTYNPFQMLNEKLFGGVTLLQNAGKTAPQEVGHTYFKAAYCGIFLRKQKF